MQVKAIAVKFYMLERYYFDLHMKFAVRDSEAIQHCTVRGAAPKLLPSHPVLLRSPKPAHRFAAEPAPRCQGANGPTCVGLREAGFWNCSMRVLLLKNDTSGVGGIYCSLWTVVPQLNSRFIPFQLLLLFR